MPSRQRTVACTRGSTSAEELRLAVEADGRAVHSGERMAAKDAQRDTGSRTLGWSTERVTWFEVRCRQEQTRQRVLARAAELRAASSPT